MKQFHADHRLTSLNRHLREQGVGIRCSLVLKYYVVRGSRKRRGHILDQFPLRRCAPAEKQNGTKTPLLTLDYQKYTAFFSLEVTFK